MEQSSKHSMELSNERTHASLKEIIDFLQDNTLPEDSTRARHLSAQEPQFTLLDGILYYIDAPFTTAVRG